MNLSTIDTESFFAHLQSRTAPFGSLTLDDATLPEFNLPQLLNHLSLIDNLDFPCFPSDTILKALAAPIQSICFGVDAQAEKMDFGTADIVPKAIVIYITPTDVFPTNFMLSFLQRVAELGHLESLTVEFISSYYRGGAPLAVGDALIRAVQANKNLETLEFYNKNNKPVWDNCLRDLLRVFERTRGNARFTHGSLLHRARPSILMALATFKAKLTNRNHRPRCM